MEANKRVWQWILPGKIRHILLPNIGSFGIVIVISFLSSILWITPVGRVLENVASRINFQVRSYLQQNPPVDPRIRVVLFDDRTYDGLGVGELTLADWADTLRAIAQKKPRAILIDKIFGDKGNNQEFVGVFRQTMAALDAPVYPGSFTASRRETRLPLPDSFWISEHLIQGVAKSRIENAYGPHPQLLDLFPGTGHIVYAEDGQIYPFYWREGFYLPALGFRASNQISMNEKGIVLDGHPVGVDAHGLLHVNLVPAESFQKQSMSLLPVLTFGRERQPLPVIDEGDVVVILPAAFTGHTDFKSTPIGDMAGGFIQVSIVNSVLSGRWLQHWGDGIVAASLLFLVVSIVATFACRVFPLRVCYFFITFGSLILVVTGIGLFVFFDIVANWLVPTFVFGVSGVLVVVDRARELEKQTRKIRSALEGLVSPNLLKTLLRNPQDMRFEATETEVSVMFVDIVGFSLKAENLKPSDLFFELKEELSRICNIIHTFGGIVDKTLGDGLLCFFGYSYDATEGISSSEKHALNALACAIAIQRDSVRRMLHAPASAPTVLPLRIGINSGPVFVGNLGSAHRIDFTIIGNTVNYAKRLEDACESFRVMIGTESRNIIASNAETMKLLPEGISLQLRRLNIKHHADELLEAWECDPFVEEPDLLVQAGNLARGNLQRSHRRVSVPLDCPIIVTVAGNHKGSLMNFSLNGLLFESDQYLAKKVQVYLEVNSPDGVLGSLLSNHALFPIVSEVRWGVVHDSKYRHGVQILNLNDAQRELFLSILLEYTMQDG